MADPEGIRQLEAILAADVAGYSRLRQDDDEATVATLEAYRAIFREEQSALQEPGRFGAAHRGIAQGRAEMNWCARLSDAVRNP